MAHFKKSPKCIYFICKTVFDHLLEGHLMAKAIGRLFNFSFVTC